MKRQYKIILILLLGAVVISCSTFSLSRDESGKLLVETTLPLSLIEGIIENAADLSQVTELELELRQDYVFVQAASVEYKGITLKDISFHLELYVENGKLSAQMTNLSVMDGSFNDDWLGPVNQIIAEKLAEAQGKMEMMDRAELVDVRVSPDGMTLVWRLKQSEGN